MELTFEKIEAAAEDVIGIANTIWEQPRVVPCAPVTWLGFLGILLLAAIGGFRPKAIVNFRFKQVKLAVVRDPIDRSKTKIAVTFQVPIVKKRQSSQGSKAKWYV
jgi:hypothetical protein